MTTALIVDDSRVSRMMIRAIISDAKPDWNIIEAESGDDALSAIDNETPDVMILDYNMPGMNGLTLGEKLKDKFPGGKISLLTANIQDSTQKKAAELGIAFVGKPITDEKIRGIIQASEI
ncbi:MAG: response regulator [Ectothiorhodospiraceae bacterium]|nr:response regulator [Ectothiorhodospiraceae bacterium]